MMSRRTGNLSARGPGVLLAVVLYYSHADSGVRAARACSRKTRDSCRLMFRSRAFIPICSRSFGSLNIPERIEIFSWLLLFPLLKFQGSKLQKPPEPFVGPRLPPPPPPLQVPAEFFGYATRRTSGRRVPPFLPAATMCWLSPRATLSWAVSVWFTSATIPPTWKKLRPAATPQFRWSSRLTKPEPNDRSMDPSMISQQMLE